MNYIPYGRQEITSTDIDEVINVLKSDYLTQGPKVGELEAEIADEVCAKYGIAVNSATSALHIACLALGLGQEDYLWTSPTTFVASANCGLYCGAEIDFVDIESKTGLMSIEKLKEKLNKAEKELKLPKVIIPVHLCGTSCDMKAIKQLSKRYGFKIIEDASHAIGGEYKGIPVGSCKYSDITVFSFHPVKIITTGEGGMAMTNSSNLAEKMKLFRSHGIVKDESCFKQVSPGPWHYEQQQIGFNYRMNDIQASLGISQVKRLKNIVKARNIQRTKYIEKLRNCPLNILDVPDNVNSSVHLVVARLRESSKEKHKRIFMELRNAGIGVQLHYSPVHLQPYYRNLGYEEGQYKESEEYAKSAFSIPTFPGLTDEEHDYVCRKIIETLK